ncbi:uncharacterized protein DS421_8g228330 [Arachis hypogaea]|nr:uncharacterized protein DS421_8g228330 [Arachis hypogaea]
MSKILRSLIAFPSLLQPSLLQCFTVLIHRAGFTELLLSSNASLSHCHTVTRVEQPPSSHRRAVRELRSENASLSHGSSHRSSRRELRRCFCCLPPPHSHSPCCMF